MGRVKCRDATDRENDIREAKHAYLSGLEPSISAAASTYGVPYGTLRVLYGGVRTSSRVCAGVCEGVSIVYRVTRHVASTYGRSMTNGANYKWGTLHHSPWHSDIRTSNQLNTPPGWLSRPFQTKQWTKEKRSQSNNVDLLETNVPNQSICFPTAFPMPFQFQFRYHFRDHFRFHYRFQSRGPFPRPFPSPIPIIPIAAHCFKKAGFGSGFVKQSASISAVGT